ncbi:hypothetical protein [Dactylosporangium sp. CA-092794]|uniref:hypothetical protein n=1 Tax=Dactylosporangium sp. CA-092794 TaxID=3239929 RepID=UPI003D9350D4
MAGAVSAGLRNLPGCAAITITADIDTSVLLEFCRARAGGAVRIQIGGEVGDGVGLLMCRAAGADARPG